MSVDAVRQPMAGRARAVRLAVLLAWVSLAWMTAEGALGLWAGVHAGSVALTGWALSSAVEGIASGLVIWRFTGHRLHSESAERRAQRGIAVSFWLLATYIVGASLAELARGRHPGHTTLGLVLTASSVVIMPGLGRAKWRLGARLDSAATRGEGTQNLLCAAMAAAVFVGLAGARLVGAWWLDPLIALGVAVIALREGRMSWRGADCC